MYKKLNKMKPNILIQAELLFPVGTEFTSVYGIDDTVTKPLDDLPAIYANEKTDTVMALGKSGVERVIYDGNKKKWATKK